MYHLIHHHYLHHLILDSKKARLDCFDQMRSLSEHPHSQYSGYFPFIWDHVLFCKWIRSVYDYVSNSYSCLHLSETSFWAFFIPKCMTVRQKSRQNVLVRELKWYFFLNRYCALVGYTLTHRVLISTLKSIVFGYFAELVLISISLLKLWIDWIYDCVLCIGLRVMFWGKHGNET